jgi:hypothetical protein
LIKLGSKTSREALNVINEQKSVSDLVEIFMNFLGFFLTFIILLTQFVNVFIQFVLRFTDSGFPFGILDLRILVSPLVS